jgi:hypothetical protein
MRSFCETGAPIVVGALFLNTPGLTEVVRPTVCAEADPHATKPIVAAIQNSFAFVPVWRCWFILASQSSTPARMVYFLSERKVAGKDVRQGTPERGRR